MKGNETGPRQLGFPPKREVLLSAGRSSSRSSRPEIDGDFASGRNGEDVVQRGLRAGLRRIHRGGLAVHHGAVKRVLDEGRRVRRTGETPVVGVVFREERSGHRAVGGRREVQREIAQRLGLRGNGSGAVEGTRRFDRDVFAFAAPGPEIAEPPWREQVQRGGGGTAVRHGQPDQRVRRRGLGVAREDIEVAAVVEGAGVERLEFRTVEAPPAVFLDQRGLGELGLRIFTEGTQPGMGGGRVEVVVEFLDTLAVIDLGAGQAEAPFLQDRIATVPEGETEAEAAFAIRVVEESVFAPAVGPAARVVVGGYRPLSRFAE